jgi:hypothetical protein
MTKDKFKTKNGNLTPYAFACGYVQEKESNGIKVKLWHEGGPLYHVMAFDFNRSKRLFWESFERLSDARAFYKKPPLL